MREHGHHPSVITGRRGEGRRAQLHRRGLSPPTAPGVASPPPLAGDKGATMEDRVRVHEEFERGITKVLICTDLSEEGAGE